LHAVCLRHKAVVCVDLPIVITNHSVFCVFVLFVINSLLQSLNFIFLVIDSSPYIIIFSLHILKQSFVCFTGARAIRHWTGKELDAIVHGRAAKWGGRVFDDGDPDFPDIRIHDICSMSRAVNPAVNNMPIGLPVSHGNIFSICSELVIRLLNCITRIFTCYWVDVSIVLISDHVICPVLRSMCQLKIFMKWKETQRNSVLICEIYYIRCIQFFIKEFWRFTGCSLLIRNVFWIFPEEDNGKQR